MEKILNSLVKNKGLWDLNSKDDKAVSSIIQEALMIGINFYKNKQSIVVIKPSLYSAQRLYERLLSLFNEEECVLFASEDSLRVDSIASSPEMMAQRVELMDLFLSKKAQIIITHATAITRQLPLPSVFNDHCLNLALNDTISIENLKLSLIKSGYTKVSHIDKPLTFAMRGGVFDIFSINYKNPIRIEFFDQEIERLCFFDIESQRSIENINNVRIICASDIIFSDEDVKDIENGVRLQMSKEDLVSSEIEMDLELLKNNNRLSNQYIYFPFIKKSASILDYISNFKLICSFKGECDEYIRNNMKSNIEYIQEMNQEKKMVLNFSTALDFNRTIEKYDVIKTEKFLDNKSAIFELDLPKYPLHQLINYLLSNYDDDKIVLVLNKGDLTSVMEVLQKENIVYNLVIDNEFSKGINLVFDFIYEGFYAKDDKLLVIGSNDLYGKRKLKEKYADKFKNAEVISSYEELNKLDYVVHNQHGVGQYMGIVTKEVFKIKKDFLRIIYRGNAELMVPLEQFRLIRKFISGQGASPKLHKLGSKEWEKTKQKLQDNVDDLAERLVELYALRNTENGHAFKEDTIDQKKFEDAFEYELTDDQAKALIEIKKDMESASSMDRLLCGDVGFGKTEVAICAAFKAVMESKQVAFLCPTTILSMQHFNTFKERFKDYPIIIEVINRFVSVKKQKEIIKNCKEGKVDILIGTHRLLGNDVNFKDLGLLVIDEEQRFGVEHKVKIQAIRKNVDVLSLSATPIPRTLQMSLIGLRQLSLLNTPPNNRHSVNVNIVEKKDGLIKEVIEKELSRDGQVFYLSNNTTENYQIVRKLKSQISDLRIQVVSGKMNKDSIEDTMVKFNNHEIDVLVCTTIIETGIDIPNANTIIIDNAQNFGLSQLYQIKGRVGRSERLAYAYLMIPKQSEISELAQKRLQAIKNFASLGSGYQIAMRDLTIRGAGDILGPEQSGFIDTVGIDMYMEMLEASIQKKKGIAIKEEKARVPLKIDVEAYIPKEYAPYDYDKIKMYKEIDKIKDEDSLFNYLDKIKDEHGAPLKSVKEVFNKRWLEILLEDDCYKLINTTKGTILYFSEEFSSIIDGVKLFETINQLNDQIEIKYINKRIEIHFNNIENKLENIIEIIKKSKGMIRNES
ncbi:MAG: transcription-repair coupling factor [Anaerorhabdus sp.]